MGLAAFAGLVRDQALARGEPVACLFGDRTCPCQDGDSCHYLPAPGLGGTGALAMDPPHPLLLNVGCGGDLRGEPWVNVDRADYGDRAVRADLTERLPWPDDTFDGAVANHSLQALTAAELPGCLAELHRVLKPNAVLRVLVPDIERALTAVADGDRAWFPNSPEVDTLDAFVAWATWYGHNRTIFTPATLSALLLDAGFEVVRPAAPGITLTALVLPTRLVELDSRPHESLIVEARK